MAASNNSWCRHVWCEPPCGGRQGPQWLFLVLKHSSSMNLTTWAAAQGEVYKPCPCLLGLHVSVYNMATSNHPHWSKSPCLSIAWVGAIFLNPPVPVIPSS